MQSQTNKTERMSLPESLPRQATELRAPLLISGIKSDIETCIKPRKQQRCHRKNAYLAGSSARYIKESKRDSGFFDSDSTRPDDSGCKSLKQESSSEPGNAMLIIADSHSDRVDGAGNEIKYPDISLLHVPGTPITIGMWAYLPSHPFFVVFCPYKARYVSYLREIKEYNWEQFTMHQFTIDANFAKELRSQKLPEYDHPELFFTWGLRGFHNFNGNILTVDEYILSCKEAENTQLHPQFRTQVLSIDEISDFIPRSKVLDIAAIPEFVPSCIKNSGNEIKQRALHFKSTSDALQRHKKKASGGRSSSSTSKSESRHLNAKAKGAPVKSQICGESTGNGAERMSKIINVTSILKHAESPLVFDSRIENTYSHEVDDLDVRTSPDIFNFEAVREEAKTRYTQILLNEDISMII